MVVLIKTWMNFSLIIQVPDDFLDAAPQILIPQVSPGALGDEEDVMLMGNNYNEEEESRTDEYNSGKEQGMKSEKLQLSENIDFSHALV